MAASHHSVTVRVRSSLYSHCTPAPGRSAGIINPLLPKVKNLKLRQFNFKLTFTGLINVKEIVDLTLTIVSFRD